MCDLVQELRRLSAEICLQGSEVHVLPTTMFQWGEQLIYGIGQTGLVDRVQGFEILYQKCHWPRLLFRISEDVAKQVLVGQARSDEHDGRVLKPPAQVALLPGKAARVDGVIVRLGERDFLGATVLREDPMEMSHNRMSIGILRVPA